MAFSKFCLKPCSFVTKVTILVKVLWTSLTLSSIQVKVHVKQSRYRPGVGPECCRKLWFSDYMTTAQVGGRLSPLGTGRLYHQEMLLVVISVRVWVNPRTIVRPEGLCRWKFPITPSGIETATFRLVAQCLKQLRQRVPLYSYYPICP